MNFFFGYISTWRPVTQKFYFLHFSQLTKIITTKVHFEEFKFTFGQNKFKIKAANTLNDVQSLKLRVEENKRCFQWCPDWIWRY